MPSREAVWRVRIASEGDPGGPSSVTAAVPLRVPVSVLYNRDKGSREPISTANHIPGLDHDDLNDHNGVAVTHFMQVKKVTPGSTAVTWEPEQEHRPSDVRGGL